MAELYPMQRDQAVEMTQWDGLFDIYEQWGAPWRSWQSPYSFQNVIQDVQGFYYTPYAPRSALKLYSDGCVVGEHHNCTAACLDLEIGPKLAWNNDIESMPTLYNCMLYPVLASLRATGNLSDQAIEIADNYHILSTNESDAATGWPVINSCTSAHCRSLGGSAQDCQVTPDMGVDLRATQTSRVWLEVYTAHLNVNASLCNNVPLSMTGNVAGPGICTALILQASVVALAWLLWRLHKLALTYYSTVKFNRRAGSATSVLDTSAHFTTQLVALLCSLDTFQKAQCLLLIVLQSFAMAMLSNQSLVGASIWQELHDNIRILGLFAITNLFPITLAQLTLRLNKVATTHTLALSAVATAVSVASYIVSQLVDYDYSTVVDHGTPLPECGGLSSPLKYCLRYSWRWQTIYPLLPVPFSHVPLVISCLVQGWLIFDAIHVLNHPNNDKVPGRLNIFGWIGAQYYRLALPQIRKISSINRIDSRHALFAWNMSLTALSLAVELFLVVMLIMSLVNLGSILAPSNDYIALKDTQWGIGQVLAVAILLPGLLLYLMLALFGIKYVFQDSLVDKIKSSILRPYMTENGTEYRLLDPDDADDGADEERGPDSPEETRATETSEAA